MNSDFETKQQLSAVVVNIYHISPYCHAERLHQFTIWGCNMSQVIQTAWSTSDPNSMKYSHVKAAYCSATDCLLVMSPVWTIKVVLWLVFMSASMMWWFWSMVNSFDKWQLHYQLRKTDLSTTHVVLASDTRGPQQGCTDWPAIYWISIAILLSGELVIFWCINAQNCSCPAL